MVTVLTEAERDVLTAYWQALHQSPNLDVTVKYLRTPWSPKVLTVIAYLDTFGPDSGLKTILAAEAGYNRAMFRGVYSHLTFMVLDSGSTQDEFAGLELGTFNPDQESMVRL